MIASALFALSYRRFRAACRNPLAAQAARLRHILARAAHTEFGRRHHFARLPGLADPLEMIRAFQRDVPVRTYREMRPELDAVYAGRWGALCPSPPLWFAMTAGSTGQFKHVPVPPEYRRDVGKSAMIFNGALEACYPEVRRLKTQFLVGSAEGGRSPAGVPQGFASGFNYKTLPRLLRRRFVVPYWVFTIEDAAERNYAIGRILVAERRLGVVGAIAPVNLINVRQALEQQATRLVADIATGSLRVSSPSAVLGEWHARPDPALARALVRERDAGGALSSRVLFPELRVLVCWQGGNMGYYLDELRKAFDVEQCFEFPVSASEGVFAIPIHPNRAGGALAVTTHFLEFRTDDGRAVLRADELEPGREYGIVVTNGGGLYRYDMEDMVRVTSFFQATPVIEFVSKKDRQVSVSNERLTELDVTEAMRQATRLRGLWLSEFLFVPCSDRRYRVLVDGASRQGHPATGGGDLRAFAAELERQLRIASKGYDFERADALLEPLELVVTASGELRTYLVGRQRSGLPNAQIKPWHLTNRFDAHRAFHAVETYAA